MTIILLNSFCVKKLVSKKTLNLLCNLLIISINSGGGVNFCIKIYTEKFVHIIHLFYFCSAFDQEKYFIV